MSVSLLRLDTTRWQLSVQNTLGAYVVKRFQWAPPTGLHVISISRSDGGSCRARGDLVYCVGHILPPRCKTCEGGIVVVAFNGRGLRPKLVSGHRVTEFWGSGGVKVTLAAPAPAADRL